MKFKWLLSIFFLTFGFLSQGQFESYLVGYYPFEKGRAKDYTRRGGNGRIYGQLKIVNGVAGDAAYFDGGNHNVVFKGNINRYLRGKRDFSISFYFRSDDLGQRSSLMGKRELCKGYRMFDLRFSKGKLGVELYKKERPYIRNNVSGRVLDNNWHHYTYVRKGNSVRLYIDGNLVGKNSIQAIIPIDDAAYFAINSSPCKGVDGTGNLRGALDELKIFRVALTKRDVETLYEKNPLQSPPRVLNQSPQRRGDQPKNALTDPRLQAIFGQYEDKESQSMLVLEPKEFILIIKNPEGYEAEELTYQGKYKIEQGDLYLLYGEITLKKPRGDAPIKIQYKEKIIGELYENGVDLFAFETRMKLKK